MPALGALAPIMAGNPPAVLTSPAFAYEQSV